MEQRSWETQDGERRSKIEVIADEIGPSLRWAPAQVTKNDRRGPADSGRGRPAPARAEPAASSYSADEEPF
jgi:single-strand DNA-binding protein